MQIETTQLGITSHLLQWPLTTATNSKCQQGYREIEILVHFWWECKMVRPQWKNSMYGVPSKNKNYHMI